MNRLILSSCIGELKKHLKPVWWVFIVILVGIVPIIHLVYSYSSLASEVCVVNHGGFWGLASDQSTYLLLIHLVILISMLVVLVLKWKSINFCIQISLVFIVVGGLGNLIDRAVSAGVCDYFWLPILKGGVFFNANDLLVLIGIAYLSYAVYSRGYNGIH